jgi:hypothetical protein
MGDLAIVSRNSFNRVDSKDLFSRERLKPPTPVSNKSVQLMSGNGSL